MAEPTPPRSSSPARLRGWILIVVAALMASTVLVGCGAIGAVPGLSTSVMALWLVSLSVIGLLVGCGGGSGSSGTFNAGQASTSAATSSTTTRTTTPTTPASAVGVKLAFQVQPRSIGTRAVAVTAITPAPQVAILDAQGNVVTTATNAITVSLAANPQGVTLSGTTTVNAVNGIATFSNLLLSRSVSGLMLEASAQGLTSAESATFSVQPLAPAFSARGDFLNSSSTEVTANVQGDFTGDGNLDVVIANADGQIQLLVGNGDGTFAAKPLPVATGLATSGMTAADVNGDGKLDLIVANADAHAVTVLLGNGDGTFQAPSNFAVPTDPADVKTGSFSSGGNVDIAVSLFSAGEQPAGTGAVAVLQGNGDGSFKAAVNYGASGSSRSMAEGVFRSGDVEDLAVVQGAQVQIFLGNGDGLTTGALIPLSNPLNNVVTTDLTGNNVADLIVGDADGHLHVLLGNGDGTFQTAINVSVPGIGLIETADFNGDGKPDVVASLNKTSAVAVLLGNGDGAFAAPTDFAISSRTGVEPVFVPDLPALNGAHPMVGDFSGDQHVDVVVSTLRTESVLLGKGDGTFSEAPTVAAIPDEVWVSLNDVDGDGKLDLLSVGTSGMFAFQHGNGDGTFAAPVNVTVQTQAQQFAVGDVNGDNHLDVVVPSDNSGATTVDVLLGNGDGTFSVHTATTNMTTVWVELADVNRDGKPDIAAVSGNGTLLVLLGNGDGTFQAPMQSNLETGMTTLAVADFNGDGKPDVVVTGGENTQILLGNGDGSFAAATNLALNGAQAIVADFNGDGKMDVALTRQSDGLTVLLGNGDGTFQVLPTQASLALGFGQAVDVNLDGIPDLVVGSLENLDAVVLLGNGDGTFSSYPTLVGTVGTTEQVAVGDLTGSGKLDLVEPIQGQSTVNVELHF